MAAHRTKKPRRSAPGDEPAKRDVVIVTGPADGGGVRVLRAKEQSISVGTLAPLTEGKPIHGEVVRLKPREQLPGVYDVTTELPAADAPKADAPKADAPAPEPAAPSRAGPAQVASDTYRAGWDRIYKRSRALPN